MTCLEGLPPAAGDWPARASVPARPTQGITELTGPGRPLADQCCGPDLIVIGQASLRPVIGVLDWIAQFVQDRLLRPITLRDIVPV